MACAAQGSSGSRLRMVAAERPACPLASQAYTSSRSRLRAATYLQRSQGRSGGDLSVKSRRP
eukprot:2334175-Pyramimonas_sp.AAC.1